MPQLPDESNHNPTTQEVIVDRAIANSGVPTWQVGLAKAINDTYSFSSRSMIYGIVPTYMKDYMWKYIRPCMEWLDGFVKSLHYSGTSGIVSTKIGKTLITGFAKQVVGEKLLVKMNTKCPNDIDKKNLIKISKWINDQKVIKPVFAGVGFALASGTALVKVNKTSDGNYWWEASRFDQCTYRTNFKGEVEDAVFLIRNYVDTTSAQGKNQDQFLLCEHRFYKIVEKGEIDAKTLQVIHAKGDKIPMVEYIVKRVKGTILVEGDAPTFTDEAKKVNWAELPKFIQNAIKNDYSVIRIGEPQELGLINLGVEPFINGNQDLGVPTSTNLGEGLLFEVQNDMITYEIAASYKIRDMYLGKGTVYMPKSMSISDVNGMGYDGGVLNGIGDNKIELLKGADPETQKAIVQQFNIRGNEWQSIMDDCVRNIATKWGMSPKVLSSYLINATQMTATQVDSEDDISISTIYHTRSYFLESINRLLEVTANAMGIDTNVTVTFASPSLINKDRVIDRQIKMLEQGLTTIEDAIREIYPDLEEEQIQLRIANAQKVQKEKKEQEAKMDNEGIFSGLGNLDKEPQFDISDDEIMKGSTNPQPNPKVN